jgi:hypothetical protein
MADTLEQKQTATDNSGKKFDPYTPWYAIWSSAFVLLMFVSNELDRVFNLYLLLVPIVILPGLILLVPHQPARLTPMTETVGQLSAAFYNRVCRQQRGRLLYGAQ